MNSEVTKANSTIQVRSCLNSIKRLNRENNKVWCFLPNIINVKLNEYYIKTWNSNTDV